MIKNWAGLEVHVTDEFVHWSDRTPKETMLQLREKYNQSLNGDASALQRLLNDVYVAGRTEVEDEFRGR